MKITFLEKAEKKNRVIALGAFDGVHRAHAKLIESAVKKAHEDGCISTVLTFIRNPSILINNHVELITDNTVKEQLIASLGVDELIYVDFTEKFRSTSAEDFFECITSRLTPLHICCGFNYHFGFGGKGDASLLKQLCHSIGIGFFCLPQFSDGNETISSTVIREHIRNGEIERANELLGHSFFICSPILHGKRIGSSCLDTPTINQVIPQWCVLPRFGVYITKTTIGKTKYTSVTNVGMRPTVGGENVTCETYILDYSGNLYGESVSVEFLSFVRPEIKFASFTDLKKQIKTDTATAKKYFEANP